MLTGNQRRDQDTAPEPSQIVIVAVAERRNKPSDTPALQEVGRAAGSLLCQSPTLRHAGDRRLTSEDDQERILRGFPSAER